MPHVSLLAAPNCSVSTIAGPVDTFTIANIGHSHLGPGGRDDGPLFEWDIVTVDGKPVQGSGGMTVHPDCGVEDVPATDLILIPGFIPPFDFVGGLEPGISGWLRARYAEDVIIASTCTGTFLLAETGLLDGKTATTNWMFADQFRKLYPAVSLNPSQMLTVNQNLICSGATTAFVDLCLYLIETFGSQRLAAFCSKAMLMESRRSTQSPYFIFHSQKDHADTQILAVQNYMEAHFSTPISLEKLASDFGFSPRHFKRRFKKATGDTPLTYLQRLRVEEARCRLETTVDTFNEITWQVGYENVNSFRKLFKKHTGVTPKEYQDRFNRVKDRQKQ